jgi:ABC-type branched-subunit amino acid transport system permease subunit
MIEFLVYLVTIAGIWSILSISLNLQYGVAGLVNLGHVAFFMLGAYTSTILVVLFGAPIVVGMLAGAVAAAIFGVLLALPAANLKEDYWAITTLAAAEIARIIFLNTRLGSDYVGEAFGVSGIPRPLREWFELNGLTLADYNIFYMVLVLVVLLVCFLLARYVANAPIGRSLKALREGDDVPLALGKSAGGLRIRVMAMGGALGGIAGALFAHYNAYIAPEYFLPVETFIVWAMVILGGPGNFVGAVVGTIIIQALYNSTRFIAPLIDIDAQILGPVRMIAIAVLIILVIMYMPNGILPERRRRYGR